MRFRSRLRARLARSEGFSLVELLITMLLLTMVLIAILGVLDTTTDQANQDSERSVSIQDTQAGVHRLATELRQAADVQLGASTATLAPLAAATPQSVTFMIRPAGGQPRRLVRYTCSSAYTGRNASSNTYTSCVRHTVTCTSKLLSSCGSLPTLATGPCGGSALLSGAGDEVVSRLQNGCITTYCPNSGAPPVFRYTGRDTSVNPADNTRICASTTTPTTTSPLAASQLNDIVSIGITAQVPQSGERRRGVGGATPRSIYLQDGVQLRNRL